MTSIMEMPDRVLEKFIRFSDFKAVLSLRQVCRDFRNFIDDLEDSKLPDSEFEQIEIISENKEKNIVLQFMDPKFTFYRMEYSASENCRKFQEKKTILENSNIVDVAIRDLELILKFQRYNFEVLTLSLDDCQLQNKLSNMLSASGQIIKTRQLSITVFHHSQVLSMLGCTDPQTLEVLELHSVDNNLGIDIDEIVKTEHWKKAIEVVCDMHLLNLRAEDVCHFSSISLKTDSFTARDLDTLKKIFLNFSKLEYWFFDLKSFNETDELSNLWGLPFISGLSRTWYFRIKDSEKKILLIQILSHRHPMLQEYCATYFYIIEVEDVPEGAIVHDYKKKDE
ncbi:hypothetical protein L3Y34_009568 [Caenorhabditis briggsae]|uniref:F-box domain-containing protein n=1 Tax=Caenorhabditis briggsae TaxID=6238 RepID=A0AAE9A608_CAEBR|nr:hypothetical protein L3Y34_009568 [Caenorhabditis briggsae]